MQTEIVIGIVAICLILVSLLPIFMHFCFDFNLLENSGGISFYLFGIRVFNAKVKFSKNQINIATRKKEKNLPIDFKDEKVRFINKLVYNLFLKIKIQKLGIMYDVGKKGDAFFPVIVCGTLNAIFYSVLGFCYTKKGVFNTDLNYKTKTDENKLMVNFQIYLLFNLLMICLVFFKTKKQIKKEKKYVG